MNKTEGRKIDTHICKVEGCFRPKSSRIGYCRKHFQQWKKHGEINIETERKAIKPQDVCQVDSCSRKIFAKGYCQRHYQQILNYGKILTEGEKPEKIIYKGQCIIEGCDKEQFAKELCSKHYHEIRNLELQNKDRTGNNKQEICRIEGCNNPYYAKGYCQNHYNELYHLKKTKGQPKERIRKQKKSLIKDYEKEFYINDKHILNVCKVNGCDKEIFAKGVCKYHYKKILKNGDRMSKNSENNKKICLVEGCGKIAKTKGYCANHYYKFRTYGNPLQENKIGLIKTCSVEGCNEKHKAKGYCDKHYNQYKAKEEAKLRGETNERETKVKNPNCLVEGCNGKNETGGYCRRHYKQTRKYQRTLTEYEVDKIKHLKCMKKDCDNKVYKMGYCEEHYNEYYHGDDVELDNKIDNKQIENIEVVANDTKKDIINCDKCGKESESISVMDFKPFYDAEETITVNLCHKCSNELIKWMIKRK